MCFLYMYLVLGRGGVGDLGFSSWLRYRGGDGDAVGLSGLGEDMVGSSLVVMLVVGCDVKEFCGIKIRETKVQFYDGEEMLFFMSSAL